eukprot:c39886_g1_i1 orf=311-1138(-)
MPAPVSSQCVFIVSFSAIPHSMQKWLCNQAPSPISRAHLTRSFSPVSEARVSKDAENQGVRTSSDALQEANFGMARRVFSTALLCSGFVSTAPALAISEMKSKGKKSPFDEQRLLEQNKRMQMLNSAPSDFPGFVREGYNVKLVTTDEYVKCKSGLIYLDIQEGQGDYPKDGQQIIFHYIGYNESGRKVDSSYQQGQPAKTRIGINAMIPGFEEGLRTMKPGGKRRLIIPPELGPPVGPSTFFSAKQFEVFDVELLDAKDCTRRTIGFYSDFICE